MCCLKIYFLVLFVIVFYSCVLCKIKYPMEKKDWFLPLYLKWCEITRFPFQDYYTLG